MTETPSTSPRKISLVRFVLWLAATTACLLVGFGIYMLLIGSAAKPLEAPLAQLVPANFGAWEAEDLPVSESREMTARVENLLKYDDVLSRLYKGPGIQLSLYVAYWNAGKIPVHEVGVHTPDTCWVVNGWKCTDRKSNCRKNVNGKPLKPFEYGKYTKDGHTEYVIFWHLVGDWTNHIKYEGWRNGLRGRIERLPFLFESFKKFGFNQRREQLFIRLSSSQPFSDLWSDPEFEEFIQKMAPLRIFEPPSD